MSGDPLGLLADEGITVAWVNDMEYSILWLPEDRVVVLNAQESRSDLAAKLLKAFSDPLH